MKVGIFKSIVVSGVIGFAAMSSSIAHSESTGIPEADSRIAQMKELGKNMKAIAAVAKGEAAYSPALNQNAMAVKKIGEMMHTFFPDGSGGEKTRAKPEIWQKTAEFNTAIDNFKMASAMLVPAVSTGQQPKIGQALQAVGKTCGGCHKPFRKPKDE